MSKAKARNRAPNHSGRAKNGRGTQHDSGVSAGTSGGPSGTTALKVEWQPIRSLQLRHNNPRTHSESQIRKLAKSIAAFGFTNPVLVDANNTVIAGHGRVRAAQTLGLDSAPTIRLGHLTAAQASGLGLADNKLAELAGWDRDLLSMELKALADLDFDLEVIGFETPEIDLLIGDPLNGDGPDPADALSAIPLRGPVVSRLGDLWRIGPHCLLCGDALEAASYARLLRRKRAQAVFIDPPYNVRVHGHASGLGRHRHAEFPMASGTMSESEYTAFLRRALAHHASHSVEGAVQFVFGDWRHTREAESAGRSVYGPLLNLCVWVKTNAGMGSLYRSQHELVFVFKVGTAPHTNNVALGRHGRHRSNVWRYAGMNAFGAERDEALGLHPTVKPVRLVADAILDVSRRGDRVLDGFAGTGTTLLAAERTGRIGYGIELEPRYVDAALRRLAEHAGLEAVHAESGLRFREVAAARAVEAAHGASASDTEGAAS